MDGRVTYRSPGFVRGDTIDSMTGQLEFLCDFGGGGGGGGGGLHHAGVFRVFKNLE